MQKNRTIWVIGTSVSIEDGGYITRLGMLLPERGIALRNLSVGDQTSVMGYMRTLAHLDEMSPGDVAVWEYSLLDVLLTEDHFRKSDVHSARRQAWAALIERDVRVIVLLSAPLQHINGLSDCERAIRDDAECLSLDLIDIRVLFRSLGVSDPATHYRDDRHPKIDSPVIAATANAVIATLDMPSCVDRRRLAAWKRKHVSTPWRWIDAATLQKRTRQSAQTHNNSLVSVQAVAFCDDVRFELPKGRLRLVAVGCVSTHETGALWCGHAGCPATSLRLPDELPYAFLLRVTSIACKHELENLTGASSTALAGGSWCDYGQVSCEVPAPVNIFGMFVEVQPSVVREAFYRMRVIYRRIRERLRT